MSDDMEEGRVCTATWRDFQREYTALQSENERLRAALREIIKVERDLFDGHTLAHEYAKEALDE